MRPTGLGVITAFRSARPAVVEWTLVPLVALAASVAALGAVLRPGRAYVGIDTVGIHVPFRTFIRSAGGLPLWNPDVLLGAPFLANGDAAELYPLSSLFFLGSPARLYGVQIALHLALCAVTTYAFVRVSLRASPAGAAVAAVLFSFNGYVLVHLSFLSFVYSQPWVPLLFLAVERTVTRGLRWAWLGVLPVAFSLLGGNPQELYESALWVPPLAVVAALAGGAGWRGAVRGLGGAAASLAGGLAVAAVQVLPQAQLIGDTSRGGRGLTFAEVSRYPLPAIPVWRVLLPDYGRPSIGENAAWIGLVGLLLVVVGIVRLVRVRAWWWLGLWTAMTAVCVLLAYGPATPLLRLAYDLVPGVSRFRFPVRWLYPAMLALAALAAAGTDAVLALVRTHRPRRPRREVAGLVVLVAGGAAVAVLGVQHDLPRRWAAGQARILASMVVLTGALAALALARARLLRPVAVAVLLPALLVGELYLVSGDREYRQRQAAGFYTRPRPFPSYVVSHGGGRVLPLASLSNDWWDSPHVFGANTNLLFGVPSVGGFGGSWPPSRTGVLISHVVGPLQAGRVGLLRRGDVLRRLDVAWVVADERQAGLARVPALRLVATDARFRLYQVLTRSARARAYCGARVAANAAEAARLAYDQARPADELVVEGVEAARPVSPGPPCGTAQVGRAGVDTVEMRVRLPRDGWVRLADSYGVGWAATVDGRPTRVYPADAALRAVRVPVGEHAVAFRYLPPGFRTGRLISLVSLVLWVGAAVVALVRPVRAVPARDDDRRGGGGGRMPG